MDTTDCSITWPHHNINNEGHTEEMGQLPLPRIMKKKNSRGRTLADSMVRTRCVGGEQGGVLQQSHQKQTTPMTLTCLISRRSWWEIESLLSSSSQLVDSIEIDAKKIITDCSVVHFALRYRAPLHIIKLLAKCYPLCLTRPDCTGKFAVHVACKYGSPPNIMEYLISENKLAAGVQDPEGKTPVHYLAECYASNYETVSHTVNEYMMEIIRYLREAAPESFNVEDEEERNAIEYAIENDSNIKVIKMMQRAARDDWRALKASGQGKRHVELAKDIKRSTSFRVLGAERTPHPAAQPLFKSFTAKSA